MKGKNNKGDRNKDWSRYDNNQALIKESGKGAIDRTYVSG